MSTSKEKKYARRMKNQPSNVSLEQDFGGSQGDGQGSFEPHRGRFSGQHRGAHQWHKFQPGGGRGRGGPSEAPQLPKAITATMFAQARAAEINAMVKAVSQKSSNSLVFQSLPRHMRRRAMGHDIKRLPRRLRELAKKEMEKTVHQKKDQPKSKCRKARRRHGNLLLEFNRRQRKNIWLETHIWFTKRFHMLKKWGYCLADRPTMKSYRTCYRAMSSHCLLQDMSYLCCLELIGKEEDLLKSLSRLCSIETGPTFAAMACLSGRRQGSLVLYRADKYPNEALGHVTFIWKPKSTCDTRQLWIWMHPALKPDILKELRLVCLCEDKPDNALCDPAPDPNPPQVEKTTIKQSGRKRKLQEDKEGVTAVPVKRIFGDATRGTPDPYRWTSRQTSISIQDLTMEVLRFRLIGPLSHSVLNDSLQAAPLHKNTDSSDSGPHSWWADYCDNPDNVQLHARQQSIFQSLQGIASPAEVPPGTILGLTVGDPRVSLPKKRTKSAPSFEQYEDREKVKSLTVDGVPEECAQSLIWSPATRSHVLENKISEQAINRMRSQILVPGSKLDLGNKESKIPILLIQQPGKVTGSDRPGWGSGWDICLPKGWGMAFWTSLIYRGVRVGGLQQEQQRFQYMAAPHVPGDFPDSPAGAQAATDKEAQLLEKYTKRPPAKRTNFIKQGILAPFLCPWDQLTREWQSRATAELVGATEDGKASEEPFHDLNMESSSVVITEPKITEDIALKDATEFSVLRKKNILRIISTCCAPRGRGGQKPNAMPCQDLLHIKNLVLTDFPRALVWVRLSMLTKGSPELHSLICIPSEQDLIQLRKDKSFQGPQEPKHGDPFRRKILKLKKDRKKQKSELKKLKSMQKKQESKSDQDNMENNVKASDGEEMNVKASDGGETNVKASDSMETNVKASDSMETNVKASDSMETNVKASDSMETNVKASDSMETNVKASDSMATNVKASDSMATNVKASVSMETNVKASVSMETNVKASDSMETNVKASDSMETNVKASLSMETNVKASVSMETNVKASDNDNLTLGLWPSPIPELTTHSSRNLIGYVTQGDFSMAVGHGAALGFVSLTGLTHMLCHQPNDQTGIVLIRNPSSFQYRFAKLTIDT
ncbi:ribonucleases P/MRP protein subunit POP1 [Gastrophryne carolinensis]